VSVHESVPARLRSRDGFTLIEVLAAMVILAVGLLALEGMAIGAARQVAAANRTTEFTLVATQELETALDRLRNNQGVASSVETLPSGARVETMVAQNGIGGGTVFDVTVVVTPPSTSNLNLRPVTIRGSYFR
jgi:prepilin-type N-terminal cleavage/methylation domain-containing protein